MIYTVFTVPPKFRNKFTEAYEWQKMRKSVWKILKDKFGACYGFEASHPTGDKSEEFHPHLNFVWRARPGVRPYVDVSMLRTAWADILGASVADVHTEFTYFQGKIMHWCKYVTRMFVGYHWWTGPIRWYGSYPRKLFRAPTPVCGVCGQPFRVIGYISAELVDSWYKYGWQLGIDPPWYDDSKISHFRRHRTIKPIQRLENEYQMHIKSM